MKLKTLFFGFCVATFTSTVFAANTQPNQSLDDFIAKMSLEEQVGQLLFVGFGGTVMDETVAAFFKEKKPGGAAFFSRNIKKLPQTLQLIRDVQELAPAGIPMFISVDQEGANVVRLQRHATVIPSNMAIGATGSEDLALRAGKALGKDLSLMGFNMNLAPVLDVATNPKNPVIGIRAFSGRAEDVARLGAAYVAGLQSEGVSAVAKHFPGHGDTASDSHFETPVLAHDRTRLDAVELLPFKRVVDEGIDALMTAHIVLPKLAEKSDLPATISKNLLTKIVRNEWQYDGLVITDGLEMHGIVSRYGSGEAAVRAVNAGADMVLILWTVQKKNEVHQALLRAVRSGRITKARLHQSLRRILRVKQRRGILNQKLKPVAQTLAELKQGQHRQVVSEIADQAITVVKTPKKNLPLRSDKKYVVASTEPAFMRQLNKKLPNSKSIRLRLGATKKRKNTLAKQVVAAAADSDEVILGLLNADYAGLAQKIRKAYPQKNITVVSFGSPFLSSYLTKDVTFVCAFGFRRASEVAAAEVLLGLREAKGNLPVDLTP